MGEYVFRQSFRRKQNLRPAWLRHAGAEVLFLNVIGLLAQPACDCRAHSSQSNPL